MTDNNNNNNHNQDAEVVELHDSSNAANNTTPSNIITIDILRCQTCKEDPTQFKTWGLVLYGDKNALIHRAFNLNLLDLHYKIKEELPCHLVNNKYKPKYEALPVGWWVIKTSDNNIEDIVTQLETLIEQNCFPRSLAYEFRTVTTPRIMAIDTIKAIRNNWIPPKKKRKARVEKSKDASLYKVTNKDFTPDKLKYAYEQNQLRYKDSSKKVIILSPNNLIFELVKFTKEVVNPLRPIPTIDHLIRYMVNFGLYKLGAEFLIGQPMSLDRAQLVFDSYMFPEKVTSSDTAFMFFGSKTTTNDLKYNNVDVNELCTMVQNARSKVQKAKSKVDDKDDNDNDVDNSIEPLYNVETTDPIQQSNQYNKKEHIHDDDGFITLPENSENIVANRPPVQKYNLRKRDKNLSAV